MKKREPVIAGNWKMNGDQDSVANLLQGILDRVNADSALQAGVKLLVAPPSVYLAQAGRALAQSVIGVSAQDISEHQSGAYTGEIGAPMAVDLGVKYTIVGHSERRIYWSESSELVARKFAAAQAGGLVPILCVGETQSQREAGKTEDIVIEQLSAILNLLDVSAFKRAMIAYEPVWAIGTGLQATPEQAQAVHATIRSRLAMQSIEIAEAVTVLYGGSVKAGSAYELFLQPDIDGALVGGASLEAEGFVQIALSALEAWS